MLSGRMPASSTGILIPAQHLLGIIVAFDSAYKAAKQKLLCICFMKM